MTWTALRWAWRLEAPLFVGMPPAGVLNRCRLYLPARAMHGAVTSELARLNGNEKGKFPDYGRFGKEVGENCRFTYLYPVKKIGNDEFLVWLPKYAAPEPDDQDRKDETEVGLRWTPNPLCDGSSLSDRDFRRRLLDSRPGTAIAPESDSAAEGTLRETECINPWWRDPHCRHGEMKAMLLLGYVFLRNNDFRSQLNNIDTLLVGGDTRYGLGKICRVEWQELSGDLSVFGKRVHLDKEHPEIQSDIVWGHALVEGQPQFRMQGAKELLGGWDQGSPWGGALTWVPGSFLKQPVAWSIDNYGYWMHHD